MVATQTPLFYVVPAHIQYTVILDTTLRRYCFKQHFFVTIVLQIVCG